MPFPRRRQRSVGPVRRRPHAAAVRRAAVEPLEGRKLLTMSLVSGGIGGTLPDGPSGIGTSAVTSAVSDDGRYVVFVSRATNLAANDGNGTFDVFARDVLAGVTTLVSATPAGASGNGGSGQTAGGVDGDINGIAISGNGRYVVFASSASDLVANDANGGADLFVRDLQTGTTTLVTADVAGTGSAGGAGGAAERVFGRPAVSDDGRYVAFSSDADGLAAGQEADGGQPDTFVRDMTTNVTRELTRPAAGSGAGAGSVTQSISGDGRFVAFVSGDRLVAGQPASAATQVYVYDNTSGATTLVSAAAGGGVGTGGDSRNPRVSGDGRFVTFQSAATNLVAGYVQSADFHGDYDLFYRNLGAGTTTLVSRKDGTAATGGNDGSGPGAMSRDGRYITFYSAASDVADDAPDANGREDAYYVDTVSGVLRTMSVRVTGGGLTGQSGAGSVFGEPPAISDDGRVVVFSSTSDDLVANDLNTQTDLFARDDTTGTVRRILADLPTGGGGQAVAFAFGPAVSGDGLKIAFAADGVGLPGNPLGDAGSVVFLETTAPPSPPPVNPGGEDPAGVDLVIGTVTVKAPAAVVAGARAKGSVVIPVRNRGLTPVNGPVTVTLYASTDGTANQGDAPVVAVTKKLKLKALSTKTLKLKISSFPAVSDGVYFLVGEVALGTGQTEETTANNQEAANQTVTIAAPFVDLAAAAPAAPKPARAARAATMVLDVGNLGNVVAAGTTAVRLTIAPAAGGAATTVDVPLKVKIKPGATKRAKLKFALPPALAAGSYGLSAQIDPANAIAEPDEANNATGAVTLTIV